MKKFILTIAISFIVAHVSAQIQTIEFNKHLKGDASISLSSNMIMNEPFGSQFAGGVKMRMFLGRRVSFNSDLVVGKNYVHFGPGIIGLPLWILGNELELSGDEASFAWLFFKIAIMALSAEHIAYHFPMKSNTDISPFISVLRFKQLNVHDLNADPEKNFAHASFVAGLELNQYFKRFVLSPYAEYNIAYDGYFRGFNFGINFGYYIPLKQGSNI